jgi:hypothetical protein
MRFFSLIASLVVLLFIINGCSMPSPQAVQKSNAVENDADTNAVSVLENAVESTDSSGLTNKAPVVYRLNRSSSGVIETVNNISNLTVVSKDKNILKAEYQAGFIQGHLQGKTIISARDNKWFSILLSTPSSGDIAIANSVLNENFNYLIRYLKTSTDQRAVFGLKRLLFRMLGIYHGTIQEHPADLNFSGFTLPDSGYFKGDELKTTYGTSTLSFMDVYFINAYYDFYDIYKSMPSESASKSSKSQKTFMKGGATKADFWNNLNPLRCSAFVKRCGGDVILAHSSWDVYSVDQSMVMTINVNGEMMCVNTVSPGQIGSMSDFGFNNKGIMFNETTNGHNYNETRVDGIFIFWRSALAEYLSGSLDDFFYYISLDNTGTYSNAYMLVNANTNEIGLADMSYKSFVFLRSTGGRYTVTTLPRGQNVDYDTSMITASYMIGENYSPTMLVRNDLQTNDTSGLFWLADRDYELRTYIRGVHDIRTAKNLMSYVNPNVRDNLMSRFDLALDPYLEEIGTFPFGALDAKVVSASMVRDFEKLSGDIDLSSSARGFWMRYGTSLYNGKPFIWSESEWASMPHPDIPDSLNGVFTNVKLNLR